MTRARLPNRRAAQICMFEHDGRRYRATFGTFGNGKLAEVFIDVGKPDSTVQQHADTSAILASLLLQAGISPTAIRHSISGPISVALDIWLAGDGEQ
jgi:hypothetical protein